MVVVIVMVVWIITNVRCLRFLSIFRTALSLSCLCVCHGQRHVTALQLRSDFLVNILSDIKNLALYYYKYEVILSLVPMNKYYCAINFFTYPLFPWGCAVPFHAMRYRTLPYNNIFYRTISNHTQVDSYPTTAYLYQVLRYHAVPHSVVPSYRTIFRITTNRSKSMVVQKSTVVYDRQYLDMC